MIYPQSSVDLGNTIISDHQNSYFTFPVFTIHEMTSYFGDPYNIEQFAIGFDLIGEHLSEGVIVDIIAEIEGVQEDYPDNRDFAIALDALYDAIGEREEAFDALESQTLIVESTIILLRMARQLMLLGKEGDARELLERITRQETEGSLPRELHIMLASARLGDRDTFTRTWLRLVERHSTIEPIPAIELIQSPGRYSLLEELPYREQIEGIEYLFSYQIPESREVEVYSLIHNFRFYLENLLLRTYMYSLDEGSIECLPALPVIKAISEGSIDVVVKIISMHGPFSNKMLLEKIEEYVKDIRQSGVEAIIMDELVRRAFAPARPIGEMLDRLREHTGGDDEPIIEVLSERETEFLIEGSRDLLSALHEAHPDDHRLIRKMYWVLKLEERSDDALMLAEQYPFLKQGDGSFYSLKLEALISSDKEAAFQLLLGEMREKRMLRRYADLFELALALDRMDEGSSLRRTFAAKRITEVTHMLNALDRLKKGKVKGGLVLIDRAIGSGFPEDLALMISAHSLLSAGYPKRVVGLCETMLESSLPPEDVYPLLIRAYRELGREPEAREAEAALEALQRPEA